MAAAAERLPIIDMHLHAHTLADYGGGGGVCTNDKPMEFPGVDPREPITIDRVMICAHPLPSATSDQALMSESIASLERHNIFAIASGDLAEVEKWRAAAPDRITPAISFLGNGHSTQQLREWFGAGRWTTPSRFFTRTRRSSSTLRRTTGAFRGRISIRN